MPANGSRSPANSLVNGSRVKGRIAVIELINLVKCFTRIISGKKESVRGVLVN